MIARLETGQVVAARATVAGTFLSRLRGWMFRGRPAPDEALAITPCDSIHTCFMRFSIDILFLDPEGRVVARFDRVAPWKFIPPVPGARSVLEMPDGALPPAATPGARIRLDPA